MSDGASDLASWDTTPGHDTADRHDPIRGFLSAPRSSRRRREKLAVLVAAEIADEIVESGLQPGDALSNEAHMLERLDVSRATLREGLRVLETQGVIAVRTGRGGGPYVTEPQPRALADLLTINFRVLGVNFEEILATRDTIEPALAAQAAANRTPADLEYLAELIEQMENTQDISEYSRLNRDFHTTVALASHNRPMTIMWSAISTVADGQAVGTSWDASMRSAGNQAHRRLLAALEACDAERAERVMSTHVTAFHDAMSHQHAAILKTPIRPPKSS